MPTATTFRPFKEQWKNQLQELKNAHQQKHFPNYYEANGPTRGKWDDTTANGLTAAIVEYIDLSGGWATRVNTMGVPRKGKDGRLVFTPSTTKKGTPDIVTCWRGRFLGVEIKIGADRQSDEQKKVQKDITEAGGVYIVAGNFVEFIAHIEKIA